MPETRRPESVPLHRTRYGTSHPEWVENAIWQQAMAEDWNGYQLKKHLGIELESGYMRQRFSDSDYRESTPGPFWSWQRFGRTSTALPDGRIIHIAGEHEDSYDPDFCIYNDVVVEYAGGKREFYLYPKDVFPPTDFHSATLLGDRILLIGSLGYADLRRPGETQVLWLDTRTLAFETVATRGEGPGWISRHRIEQLEEGRLLVVGGMVETADDYGPNPNLCELDLATMTWRRRPHGDVEIFPVPADVYRTHKSPRHGAANPERADNPFWIAMVERGWPSSRARLHYGDIAPPEPPLELSDDLGEMPEYGTTQSDEWMERLSADIERSKLKRRRTDIVWTAAREDAARLALADGRILLIGGEVEDHGTEYADPWVYNDIVVTNPDGRIEILAYPKDVFPHLRWIVAAAWQDRVYIFGRYADKYHPGKKAQSLVLRLDTRTFEVTQCPEASAPRGAVIYQGAQVQIGARILFPLRRQRDADPILAVAFDMATETWGAPEPYPERERGDD